MITNKILDYVFSAQSNLKVLRVLNERNTGISGREAARLCSLSVRAVQKTLVNLSITGLIKIAEGNREHLYSIDREKYLVRELVEKIFETERKFNVIVIEKIKIDLNPYAVSLVQFGSTVRGEETLKSDLDICIVYDKNLNVIEEKVSELRSALFKKYNITLAPLYISANKFRQIGKQNKAPVNNIVKEGRIIAGKSIKELLYG